MLTYDEAIGLLSLMGKTGIIMKNLEGEVNRLGAELQAAQQQTAAQPQPNDNTTDGEIALDLEGAPDGT